MTSRFVSLSLPVLALVVLLGPARATEGPASPIAAGTIPIPGMELLPVLKRARDVGPADPGRELVVAVSLPYAHPAGMAAFVDAVSNPESPDYRHFITPEEVGERFGPPLASLDRIASYLGQHGLEVTELGRNRLAVVARGTVAEAEQAFHTSIRSFELDTAQDDEPSAFIAPAQPVRLPVDLAATVIDVCGLDTYTRPRPFKTLLTPFLSRSVYDAQPIFDAGLTGEGRTIGVSNFDGFRSSNWPLYVAKFALPVPAGGAGSNITVVPVSGGGAGAGPASGEGDLDIQMELGMAPLAEIRIYDSPANSNLIAVLSQEASDNACDAISESYGWGLTKSTANSAHNQHLSMSAEGITYMAASGDSGTTLDPYGYPDADPEVLAVGGTVASVNATTGARISEVNWAGGGGGWSTKTFTFNVRPAWQTGTGVPPVTASTDRRLVPDVAFHSSGFSGAYQYYQNDTLTSAIGTSFASPVFAGQLQLVSQQVIALGGLAPDANGHRRFGRIQDLIYSQDNDAAIWFDITTGKSNGALPDSQGTSVPGVGWDTCVGWGPMDCMAFADAVVCATGGCGASPWTDLGQGLAGINGLPALAGSGSLDAGSQATMILSNARPDSIVTLVFGLAPLEMPYKGGTLVPAPDYAVGGLPSGPAGSLALTDTWPVGIPSGFSLWFQEWVADAAAPMGFSATNGLMATAP